MQRRTSSLQEKLELVESQSGEVLNFVENQQKKPIMVEISQDFKKLEKDLYHYAHFLECSP